MIDDTFSFKFKFTIFYTLFIGGFIAVLFGFLIGTPVLKLTDDYLAIATLMKISLYHLKMLILYEVVA